MTTASLNQSQREALLNLLALGMYADNHLSLKEDEALVAGLDALDWESGVGRTMFLDSAVTRASQADTDGKVETYLADCAKAFDSTESKRAALECLTRFLHTDGIAESETPFLEKLDRALNG
jgi:hypothetical protein